MMLELWQLLSVFFRVGLFTVGGGYAMLPMLTREVVEKYKWLDEQELLNVYALGQSIPGIIGCNVAAYIGYRRKKLPGALAGAAGMVLPSLIIICLIAAFLGRFDQNPYVIKAFAAIRAVIGGILLVMVINMSKKIIKDVASIVFCLIAFILVIFHLLPVIWVILGGGTIAVVYYSLVAHFKNKKGADK